MTCARGVALATAGWLAVASGCGSAQPRTLFDIPAEDLAKAIQRFAAQSGAPIVASPALIGGHQSPGARGDLEPAQALDRLLGGTGLKAERVDGAFVIRPAGDAKGEEPRPDIVVTGTRIRGAAPVGSPVTIIDRKTIEQSGRATIADFLQTVPQNFGGAQTEATAFNASRNSTGANTSYGTTINLRGLGASSTLTLIDGSRPALSGTEAAFSDISLIPAIAVDRIEIMTDGASSIYGSDAVAGVVNLRLRNQFSGLEASFYSGSANGDLGQYQASVIAGRRWRSGGVVIAYQFDHRGRLRASDRAYATQDLSRFGGPDNRTSYALPATIVAADGSVFSALRQGTSSQPLTSADLVPGSLNRMDEARALDLLPRQESHAIFASADQALFANARLYVRGLWAQRHFRTAVQAFDEDIEVTPNNPYYVDPLGTGEAISVQRSLLDDLGRPRQKGFTTGLNLTTGITGDLGPWHYDLSGALGRQQERRHETGYQNDARLAEAAMSSDPATAFNPFGPNLPAVVSVIGGTADTEVRYTVGTGAARFDGPVIRLPAGSFRLAFGAEYRHERFRGVEINDEFYGTTPARIRLDDPRRRRHITAEYAELAIPVFASSGLPGRLDLSASGRIEQYSDVGTTRNPKLAARWSPVPGLAVRGSWGTSFRAPGFFEIGSATDYALFGAYLPDPTSPTGRTAVIDRSGNAIDMGPERATSWTVGADIKPVALPGLTVSLTYFNTHYRDRIDSASYNIYSFLEQRSVYGGLIEDNPSPAEVAALFADPQFRNLDGITPGEVRAITDGRTRNLSAQTIRGVDLNLDYARPLAGGTASATLSGSRILSFRQRLTEGAAPVELASTYAYPVKLRLRGSLGWRNARFDATASINYTGPYRNTIFDPAPRVTAWTTFDAQIGCTIGRTGSPGKTHLALTATNLLDRRPPFIANVQVNSTLGYDSQAASPLGRVVAFQGRFSW